jgi:hypothetical protein
MDKRFIPVVALALSTTATLSLNAATARADAAAHGPSSKAFMGSSPTSWLATLVAPCERGTRQPECDVPTLRYLDEITSLFEHLTRIVGGMFCQLPQRGKMPLEFPTPTPWRAFAARRDPARRHARRR